MAEHENTEEERIVSYSDFAKRASLSRGAIYNMVARKELPEPVTLTGRRKGFPASVVNRWFATKLGQVEARA
jgi:predicted DNA-binding transcriptional regulator AlpA